jgi:hypothetical protein
MRLAKILGAAGALITAGLVGGTLIGTTLAVDDAEADGRAGDVAAYCDIFLDTFASELGTTRDGVVAAGKAAANAAIDAAVAAGDLPEERATTMRERVDAFDGTGCELIGRGAFGGGGRGGHGPGGHLGRFIGGETLGAAADALGLEPAELPAALRDAGSLEALATAQGVSYDDVRTSVLAAVQADLDAAVASGDIEQERADRILERATTWLDDGGELRGRHGQGDDTDDTEEDGT